MSYGIDHEFNDEDLSFIIDIAKQIQERFNLEESSIDYISDYIESIPGVSKSIED